MYLSYDIKGIQRFIFSVPKLKALIGGSELISSFDRDSRAAADKVAAQPVFAAGGRGAFLCPDLAAARQLEHTLVATAHQVGLDLRCGIKPSLSEAALKADRLYPFTPADLAGEPCAWSGLWPVAAAIRDGIHPLVRRRAQAARKDSLGKSLIADLKNSGLIPEVLSPYDLQFFRSVNADPDADDDADAARAEAEAASFALGGRNRWAIVAMDGNDMGRQFLATRQWSEDRQQQWLTRMSAGLTHCTRESVLRGLGAALSLWTQEGSWAAQGLPEGRVILPFRPLVIGGDDITLLCHAGLALPLVQEISHHFRARSQELAETEKKNGIELWPATSGALSISAGILFCKTTFPLHIAIPYAESLLASAKGRYRNAGSSGPAPAAVDWDAVTDTMLDTPAARRNRELRFIDLEIDREIQLTDRPFSMDESLPDLLKLKAHLSRLPGSLRASILPGLRQPWSQRIRFLAAIGKRHEKLKDLLWEDPEGRPGSGWREEGNRRITALPDALILLEEDHRMQQGKRA